MGDMKLIGLWLGAALLATAASAVASEVPPPLSALDFLIGKWLAVDTGEGPGKGGTSSIHFELGGKVVQRRDHVRLRKGGALDIAMTIYPAGDRLRAEFFDSEGHIIRYRATVLEPEQRVVFTSESDEPGPTFRLTYEKVSKSELNIVFEIAAPGPTQEFKIYSHGHVRRRQ